jgi:hypothetical protein
MGVAIFKFLELWRLHELHRERSLFVSVWIFGTSFGKLPWYVTLDFFLHGQFGIFYDHSFVRSIFIEKVYILESYSFRT